MKNKFKMIILLSILSILSTLSIFGQPSEQPIEQIVYNQHFVIAESKIISKDSVTTTNYFDLQLNIINDSLVFIGDKLEYVVTNFWEIDSLNSIYYDLSVNDEIFYVGILKQKTKYRYEFEIVNSENDVIKILSLFYIKLE